MLLTMMIIIFLNVVVVVDQSSVVQKLCFYIFIRYGTFMETVDMLEFSTVICDRGKCGTESKIQ